MNSTTATFISAFRIGLGAGLLLGAALLIMPARADEMSLEGQIAQARLVGQVSTALSGYAHHVDSLAQNLSTGMRGRMETAATAHYRRVVWFVSALQSSATAVETDEYAEIQQMVAVYGELQDHVATTARSGDMDAAARRAQAASAVAYEIKGALQRIASRDYDGLFDTAAAMNAERSTAFEIAPSVSKVAIIR
jgi:hypothetical protein